MVDLNERHETLAALEPGAPQPSNWSVLTLLRGLTAKKLRGGFLFGVGWLLSPLCWWNDLIFNLPIAYGFGLLCQLLVADWLLPGMVVGYWLSNLVGIFLMQAGAVDVFQAETHDRDRKKELLIGVCASTVFTLAIVVLAQFKLVEVPLPFATNPLHLGLQLPLTVIGR
ncbi:hypothetical protein H6F76_04665 [Leptolyngbya sp. FACHB-321]|uniref:hypothetical protein n=1 Tax=Leptolyngbya sp. FACHB-321 TaxID=2692807 RepID=UPI001685CBC3|nr:hypothetical protein [Leptolyngbya sp. FACHB-321]MBD2034328.1 hypothetical protein [Leptolyngbya sp. FACHB-321]